MKVQGWKCEDESVRMKVRGWKCEDEISKDEKSEDEKAEDENAKDERVRMKVRGWKCKDEISEDEISKDEKSEGEKAKDENARMKLRGWSVTQPCALAIPRRNLVFLLPLMLWLLQSRLTSFEEKVIWNCWLLLHYSIKTKGWPLLFLLLPLTFVLIASWKFLFSTMPADNDNVVTHGAPLNQPQLVSIFLPVFIHI